MKVDRSHHGNEIADAIRVQGREAETEDPSLAYAEEVDGIEPVRLQDLIYASGELSFEIILEGREAIRAVRITPIDQVHIQSTRQESADERAIRLEVHHVRPIHQRVDDE